MPGIMEKLFGPPPKTAAEQASEWKKKLQSEARGIDKHIRKIQQEELKTKMIAKQAAKKGDQQSVRLLAKEMIRARQAVKRLNTTKAQMNSVAMQINMQMSQVKVTKALANSAGIMRAMNGLARVPEVAAMMQELSKEMTKSGLIEEVVDDAFESMDEDIDEKELDAEVNSVVQQIMEKQLKGTDMENQEALPDIQQQQQQVADDDQQQQTVDDDEEDAALQAKFAALTGAASAS